MCRAQARGRDVDHLAVPARSCACCTLQRPTPDFSYSTHSTVTRFTICGLQVSTCACDHALNNIYLGASLKS